MFDNQDLRARFPALMNQMDKPIVYFDNAASTQKPKDVLLAVDNYNRLGHANIHRGAYDWAERSTALYEETRYQVKQFLNAEWSEEIIFTRGTTESLNLVASSYGQMLGPQDRIVVSLLEHHSNFVPWQQLALKTGAKLDFLGLEADGRLVEEEINQVICPGVKLVAITQMSNVLGIRPPIELIIERSHQIGAVVVVDAAQSLPHQPVDVQSLKCDFLAFSGHKLYAHTGIGVLYAKKHLLEQMSPYQYGGDMIEYVSKEQTTFAPLPMRFEAGTPNIDGVVSLQAALTFVQSIGYERIQQIEQALTIYTLDKMKELAEIEVYGPITYEEVSKGPVIAFNVKQVHPHDVATVLGASGIAVRAGHHCAQPLMTELGLASTVRLSLAMYNTQAEVDYFIDELKKVRGWLGYGS